MSGYETVPGWGSDALPEARPGVPKEWSLHPDPGAHWVLPERQVAGEDALERSAIPRVTPAFGTSLPPRGLAGVLRRRAYGVPEQLVRHWALLMLADRVERWSAGIRKSARGFPLKLTASIVVGLVARELVRR